MDYAAHVREQARWLAEMFDMPGELAREHAELRERELMASDPMYAVLPDLIRQERRARRERKQ